MHQQRKEEEEKNKSASVITGFMKMYPYKEMLSFQITTSHHHHAFIIANKDKWLI